MDSYLDLKTRETIKRSARMGTDSEAEMEFKSALSITRDEMRRTLSQIAELDSRTEFRRAALLAFCHFDRFLVNNRRGRRTLAHYVASWVAVSAEELEPLVRAAIRAAFPLRGKSCLEPGTTY